MYPYLFLFFHLFLAVNSEVRKSLEERYIELLPEGDRLEFLGKVARRIQEEVNTDIKPKKPNLSLEDDDLKPHSEYVNKVLKEEAIKFVALKDSRRQLNETSSDNLQIEQNSDNGDDKRITSEDLTLREKDKEEVTTKVLSEHETESIKKDSEVNEVVTHSNIDDHYVDDINITVPVTDFLLTENNETTANTFKELITSTIESIKLNVDESKISERILKNVNQQVNTEVNQNVYRTKLEYSKEDLSYKDENLFPKERLSKKKDLSKQFYESSLTGEPVYLNSSEIKTLLANDNDDDEEDRKLKGHEVYEIDPNESELQRKDTVYYPHQEKSQTLMEEPYYIPVYNYDIRNAYYNAKNRLGPNEENLENENFEDKPYQRDGENYKQNLDYEIEIPKNIYNQHQNPYNENHAKKSADLTAKRIITIKKPTHDNDYFDLDYYFGRNVENDEENFNRETTEGNMKSKILNGRFKVIGNGKGEHKVFTVVPEDELHMKTKDEKILMFIKVINDMIKVGSDALLKYDWLGTTIDILAAADKMNSVLREERLGVKLNSQDKQIIEYLEYLFEHAKYPQFSGNIDAYSNDYYNDRKEKDSRIKRVDIQERTPQFLIDVAKIYAKLSLTEDTDEVFPKNWKDVTGRDLSDKHINDVKYFGRNMHKELENFISDMEAKLYGLHTTIRDIAINTKYKDQNWFNDIKEKYLRILTREKLLEILLHINSAGLLDVIEASADNGAEFDFQKYIRDNESEVKRTIDRFKVVITLVNELNA